MPESPPTADKKEENDVPSSKDAPSSKSDENVKPDDKAPSKSDEDAKADDNEKDTDVSQKEKDTKVSKTEDVATEEKQEVKVPILAQDGDETQEAEATFPQQLMDVIESETKDGITLPDGKKVLEWLPSGDAFIVRNKQVFEKEVCPKHFSTKCKFMSFVRKLYR